MPTLKRFNPAVVVHSDSAVFTYSLRIVWASVISNYCTLTEKRWLTCYRIWHKITRLGSYISTYWVIWRKTSNGHTIICWMIAVLEPLHEINLDRLLTSAADHGVTGLVSPHMKQNKTNVQA